jgi:Glycosyl transferase family 2
MSTSIEQANETVRARRASAGFAVVAIIAAYNEADIIEQVVIDLLAQGVDVYFLDDGSTDGTTEIVQRYLGRGVLAIEHLNETFRDDPPRGFEWERILVRKAQVAQGVDANWFIHNDADEFRESPWSGVPLAAAIERVDALGFNAIDSMRLDFWPVHDSLRAGDDVREAFTFWAMPAPYDRRQVRCWKKTASVVDLASSGGHEVQFAGRTICPVRFILRHYPIRGQAHGERKIRERRARFLQRERERGWHVQYDEVREGVSFIRDPSTLTPYDPEGLRIQLSLHHRGIEELERLLNAVRVDLDTARAEAVRYSEDLDRTRAELMDRNACISTLRDALAERASELDALHRDLSARDAAVAQLAAEAAGLTEEITRLTSERAQETEENLRLRREALGLRQALDDLTGQLEALHRSWSWRCTSPARAAYRIVRRF